ncbi:Mis12-domain-containing protein [Venturia nashicola]|uniref:Mis12-domain-containing protein n=1 Tax=Venturia nashicola TaxID=86259 RepID=A0A4Z1P7E4_9PEZI|nr:Mis12-domain-containing protein [Venturia nashicola]TLD27654.1 Mis12-domain-containing protein [Venturia nashicola]
MASTRQIESSLLTEHLRYTPLTLLDDIINTINELVSRAVDAAEQGLLAADPANLGFDQRARAEKRLVDRDGVDTEWMREEARREIEEGVHQLETLLESNVDKNFDKLEIYVLRNVLCVEGGLVDWVRLGHYEDITIPDPNSTSPVPTPESIQQLRRKVQETRKLHAALEKTAKRNEATLSQLRSLINPSSAVVKAEQHSSPSRDTTGTFSFLTNTPSAQSLGIAPITSSASPSKTISTPLETNTSFTLTQLPALKALLNDLRPKLAELGGDAAVKESEQAKERRIYIENQTRKVLEKRGVEIGDEAVEMGRRVPPEELAALEGIVEGMGGSAERDKMEE